jgi:hypothetical protein
MHGRLVYLFKKFFDSSFKEFDYYKLSFKSLNVREIIDLYRKSDVILDINHPGQNGLTMRTFESIGARKKLITTNPEVKKYCFYNPNNIQVIDRNNVIIDISIFESSYEDIDDVQYNKLTLEGWINSIFFDAETNFWIPSLT